MSDKYVIYYLQTRAFKQACWELWSLLHMAHWHVYILFDRLTCTMTCQVKQMIGIVSWAKVPWQKLQTKVVSTSCFEMSLWGSLEAKNFFSLFSFYVDTVCGFHWFPLRPGFQGLSTWQEMFFGRGCCSRSSCDTHFGTSLTHFAIFRLGWGVGWLITFNVC